MTIKDIKIVHYSSKFALLNTQTSVGITVIKGFLTLGSWSVISAVGTLSDDVDVVFTLLGSWKLTPALCLLIVSAPSKNKVNLIWSVQLMRRIMIFVTGLIFLATLISFK